MVVVWHGAGITWSGIHNGRQRNLQISEKEIKTTRPLAAGLLTYWQVPIAVHNFCPLVFCPTWSEINGKDVIFQAWNIVCPCSVGLKQTKTQIKSVRYLLSGKFLAFASQLQLGNSGAVQKWKNSFLRGVSAIRWETSKWKLLIFMWTPVPKANGRGSVFFPWKTGIESVSIILFQLWFWCFYSLLYILSKTYTSKLCFPTAKGQAVETE